MLNDLRRWVDPRVWSVRIADLRAYLQRKGWTACPALRPQQLAFEEPAGNPNGPARLYMPASEEFSDYSQRILEAVTVLAEIEGRYAVEVLDDILQSRATAEPNGAGIISATAGFLVKSWTEEDARILGAIADTRHDEPGTPRPWEQPGAVRRDCEPHRAELLGRLAMVSLVCGIAAPALVVTALPGVAAGHAAYWLAEHDLRAMAEGCKDPTGRERTEQARRRAQVGIALSVFSLTGCALFWLLTFNLLQGLANL